MGLAAKLGQGAQSAASAAGGVAATAGATASTAQAGVESAAFLENIRAVQAQANAAALANAQISNEKALTDALGKNVKGTGESVKNLGAQ